MFDIRFSKEIPDDLEDGVSLAYGQIQIGDFQEIFVASLFDWTKEAYCRQWLEAAERLVKGESKSAFVSSFVPPKNAHHFVWWPSYRIDEVVYVQNQLRFYEQLASPFEVASLYDFVVDRKRVSEDEGSPISEWELPIQWVRDFLIRVEGENR